MHGDLSDMTLAAICRALASDGATGRLVLDGAEGPGSVTLRNGAVSDARSPRPRARLAGRLTSGGHLDELTLARVLQDLRGGLLGAGAGSEVVDDLALARALLERGLVDPLVIEDVLVGQIVDGMVELRTLRTGRYGFEPSGPDRSATSVRPLLDVETLLAEVRRREEQLAGLPPAALRPDTVPHLQLGRVDSDDHLGADAVTVLGAVDDRRSVEELARALGYGGYDLACVLADLSERGAVTFPGPVDDIGAALDLALRWSDAQDPTPVADDDAVGASGAAHEVRDLVDAAGTSGSTPFGSDADDHPPASDPAAAAAASEPISEATEGNGLPPGLTGRVEGDTDVSEFLRELSSLARGDDAPPTRRTSAAPAGDATTPADDQDDARTGSTADDGAEGRSGASRSRREAHRADEATDRGNGPRRRRRLFGRG